MLSTIVDDGFAAGWWRSHMGPSFLYAYQWKVFQIRTGHDGNESRWVRSSFRLKGAGPGQPKCPAELTPVGCEIRNGSGARFGASSSGCCCAVQRSATGTLFHSLAVWTVHYAAGRCAAFSEHRSESCVRASGRNPLVRARSPVPHPQSRNGLETVRRWSRRGAPIMRRAAEAGIRNSRDGRCEHNRAQRDASALTVIEARG